MEVQKGKYWFHKYLAIYCSPLRKNLHIADGSRKRSGPRAPTGAPVAELAKHELGDGVA